VCGGGTEPGRTLQGTYQAFRLAGSSRRTKGLSHKDLVSVGFTLTGRDDLEPGASTNLGRIRAMKELHSAGISTWASIEPVIDPDLSFEMIREMAGFCDHYKIGILSGKKSYTPQQIRDFVAKVQSLGHTSIY